MTVEWRARTATNTLLLAFGLSLLLHLAAILVVETGYRLDFWNLSPFGALAKVLNLDTAKPKLPPATAAKPATKPLERREPQEVQVQFVDVDPSQSSEEVPENTRFYSAVSSRASNLPTPFETSQPKLDGKQNVVPKTLDTERAKPLQPTPKAPVAAKPIEDGADEKPTRPKEAANIGPKPDEVAQKPVEARQESKPGDLAMTKPGPEQKAIDKPAAPNVPEGEPKKTRPRTVAAARAQMDDKNAYSALVGQKMAQEGGVRRFSVSPSLDVKGTPLGGYDARLVAAVQECWYALLEQQRYSLDRLGRVEIEFKLTVDGRIADMKVLDSDVGEIYTTICQLAITKPSPYEKWPADVRKLVGGDSRLVRFTFYY